MSDMPVSYKDWIRQEARKIAQEEIGKIHLFAETGLGHKVFIEAHLIEDDINPAQSAPHPDNRLPRNKD